jgi:tetratricopeptide (TPR) repeat protein
LPIPFPNHHRAWRRHPLATALVSTFGACLAALPAQQVEAVVPMGAIGEAKVPGSGVAGSGDDLGVPAEMFENPNLDRYLRRAMSFLERQDHQAAIEVLQDVVEGRTVEVVAARPAQAEGEQPAAPSQPARPEVPETPTAHADAGQAVYSQDGRIYRPVRRLCHELLASLPPVGIAFYRSQHEVAAENLLRQAEASGDLASLEQVVQRYFVTHAAGRAMALWADRLMHEGRHRAAAQVWRDLVEVYPAANREVIGVREVWCRFKAALCLRLAGEAAAAREQLRVLAERYPDESLRIAGELEAIASLPASDLFGRDVVAVAPRAPAVLAEWSSSEPPRLVPLWQYRFRSPEPYRDVSERKREQVFFFDGGMRVTAMPFAGRYGPATWVSFDGGGAPRVTFFEHFRLRVAEPLSGLLVAATDALDEAPQARDNQPRVRIAAVDHALLRPVEDEHRRYAVIGHTRNTSNSLETLRSSELVAYDRQTLRQVWTSGQWLVGDLGLAEVTFLAAPTLHGERLLLPALRSGSYTLECLDRHTGRPLWSSRLHRGGTRFFKAPGCPVAVQGGLALVLTNAGCLAAVDATSGDLRWIRRYERLDPMRPAPAVQVGIDGSFDHIQFQQMELPSFVPNDLIVRDGAVVFAPCDGQLVICLDASTGEPIWMLDGTTRYAPYGRLRALVGADAETLFVTSDTHLVAIDLAGGLVRWARDLPAWNGATHSGRGRGRGAVVGQWVVLPGERELVLFDTGGQQRAQRVPLPTFDPSRDPIVDPCNVVAAGPFVALGFQGAVELYGIAPALRRLAAAAQDPLQRALALEQAGDVAAAEAELAAVVDAAPTSAAGLEAARRLLGLVTRRATPVAQRGDVDGALAMLDTIEPHVRERAIRLYWHLARVELCKQAGVMRRHEQEQQRLYDYMEGRG